MVDTSAAVRRGHPIFFITLLITSFIAAVIASTLTNDYRKHDNASQGLKDKVHFSVFSNWWLFLFSGIFLGTFLAGVGGIVTSIASHFVILFLSWVFSLAAAASLTDNLNGGVNCSNVNLPYCNSVEALLAFNWINWILLTFALAFVSFIGAGAFRGGRGVKESLA